MQEILIPESGRSLEKEIATRSSILAWKISWTEEPGRLQFVDLQKSQIQLGDWTTTTKPLLVSPFANIFSQSVGCLFVLFMVSFSLKKLINLIRSHLFTFGYTSTALGDSDLRQHWYSLCQKMFCLCSLLGVFISYVLSPFWVHVCVWSEDVFWLLWFTCVSSAFPMSLPKEIVFSPLYWCILASFVLD